MTLNLQGTGWTQLPVTFGRLGIIQAPLRIHSTPHSIKSKIHSRLMKNLILINNVNMSSVSWQLLFQCYNSVKIMKNEQCLLSRSPCAQYLNDFSSLYDQIVTERLRIFKCYSLSYIRESEMLIS